MLKSYKYRLNPTQNQIILLNKHFGCVRFVYNYFLNERIEEYQSNKNSLNYYDNSKSLTQLKKENNYIWLKEINSQTLQYSLKSLDGAYQNFFNRRAKFPKFKSKKTKNSFNVPQNVKIDNNKLIIPKFREGIRYINSKKFKGKIRSCTISRTPTNKYFVSILVDTNHNILPKTNKTIGIDLGLKDIVVTNENDRYRNTKYFKKYKNELKINQKHLSRKQRGSNRYEKQRIKVARTHEKITNFRKDTLNKISTDLIKEYDIIILEDLSIKNMIKDNYLSQQIADVSWGMFVQMLDYKATWNQKQIIKVNRFFPSSKLCNKCNWINNNLTLYDREWTCKKCGTKHDRDLNAAKNIFNEGLKIISDGTSDYKRGDEIRHLFDAQSMKRLKVLT